MSIFKIDSSDRNHVIDFTKGFLVATMVAYHTLNYFLYGDHIAYAYVGFVSQAFIFYSGFMCGTIYFQKFLDNKKTVYKRLTVRGLKLIILWFILNIIIHALLNKNFNNQDLRLDLFFNNIFSIFLTGDDRIARFAILLPIGYVLLISAPLINLHKFKYTLYALLLALLMTVSIFKIQLHFNLACIITGICGLFTGLIYNEMRVKFNDTLIQCTGIVLLLLFLFILIPLGIDAREYFIVYFLYINMIIYNLHLFGSFLNPSGFVTRHVIKFGQYSLFLYLSQIFLLQIIKRIFYFRLSSVTTEHLLIFISVNILLVGLCYLADYLRQKVTFLDKFYRFIFA
jgi:hypothetical protein